MNSILIAESGASKTAWRWCLDGQLLRAWEGPGLNPNTLSEAELAARIRVALAPGGFAPPLEALYFYGAGLRQLAPRDLLTRLLRQAVGTQVQLEVQDDLVAAVRSTGWSQGMVAILGTGSNACRFAEDKVLERRGGLGYLLGDEGSATDLGRCWLRALIQETLPPQVVARSLEQLGRPVSVLLREVYQAERPAAFLAGLIPSLAALMEEPTLRTLVRHRFTRFLDDTICQFDQYQTLPMAVVGSVGYHLQTVLLEASQARQVEVPLILAAPIDGLMRHHALPAEVD
jgi:hypothetical protein